MNDRFKKMTYDELISVDGGSFSVDTAKVLWKLGAQIVKTVSKIAFSTRVIA